MNDRVRYELRGKLSYSDTTTGDKADATFIEIHEPTGLMVLDAAPIRQALTKAFQEDEDAALVRASRLRAALFPEGTDPDPVDVDLDEEDDPEPPRAPMAEDVDPTLPGMEPRRMLTLLSMSSVDLAEFYRNARAFLLKPGVAWVDGKMPLMQKHFDEMSVTDAEQLIGAFAGGFSEASS